MRKPWQQGIVIGALLLIAVWLGTLIVGLVGKAHIAITQAREVKEQYAALEVRKAALEANLDAVESTRGKDAAVRTAFGVAKDGEKVIVLVPRTATTTATATPPWWRKILHWF